LWEAKRIDGFTGEGRENIRMDAWREKCIKGRMDRGKDGLLNSKMNYLKAG
jgi:hypothetical protein